MKNRKENICELEMTKKKKKRLKQGWNIIIGVKVRNIASSHTDKK